MSSSSRLSPWPQYPNIPIYLDTPDGRKTPKSYGAIEKLSHAPEITTSGRSVRYLRVASPIPPTNFSRKVSHLDTPGESTKRLARRPPLRYFLDKRLPQETTYTPADTQPKQSSRFSHFSLSQSPHYIELKASGKSNMGLGISDVPSNGRAPTAEDPLLDEKDESHRNLAQRFEKRIWQYNSSSNVIKRWLLEIISWVLSAICMSAIIGMLLHVKDKRPPQWPLHLTLNTYISVLSKIASAALLLPTSEALGQLKWSWFQGDSKKMWDFEIFDNASRGPWGSLLLIIRTKGKKLAALGAAVTILSLALDPFFQQVIDFPDRTICDGKSSIPKVIRYQPHFDPIVQDGRPIAQQPQEIQFVANQFFYGNGTQPVPLGNGTRAEIPLSCPTSNCTWPDYNTLGVCSACEDVSQFLEFACRPARVDWVANLTGAGTEPTYPNGTVCGYFLNATNDIPVLMSGYLVDAVNSSAGSASSGEALLTRALPLVTYGSRSPLYGGSVNFRHIRNPIVDVMIASATDGAASVYRNETPIMQECVLHWCVKTIRSSYYWASYNEAITNTTTNSTVGPYPFKVIPVPSPDGIGFSAQYTQDITIVAPSNNSNATMYGLSNLTAIRTINIFDDIFPSFTSVQNSTAEPKLRFKTYTAKPSTRPLEFNPWLAPNNLTTHIDRLATALTNAVRSSTSKEMVTGMAFNKENFVSVRWIWLALPLALLFLSFVFLIATVIKSSREMDDIGVRKTSAIATLLYGLPDDMQKKIVTSTMTGTPRAKAKEIKVRLLPKGWRVSGNLLSPTTPKVRSNPPPLPPPGWI